MDLLEPDSYRTYVSHPEQLRALVDGNPGIARIVIDEIQKVPALLDVVQQLIEEKSRRSLQFILTGSSSRKLRRAGVEVDFIVYGQDMFLAIEVKSSRRVSSKDMRALKAFLEDYPQARACLLYGGRDRLLVGGIPCLPCAEFLITTHPGCPNQPQKIR